MVLPGHSDFGSLYNGSLFLENELYEGGIQIVSDVLVFLLFGDKFV